MVCNGCTTRHPRNTPVLFPVTPEAHTSVLRNILLYDIGSRGYDGHHNITTDLGGDITGETLK